MMRWANGLVGILVACGIHGAAQAQSCIPVWQGFSLEWTYPHTLGRFGSRVSLFEEAGKEAGCSGSHQNFAVPGNGADPSRGAGYHTLVTSNLLESATGTLSLSMAGKEGELLQVEEVVAATPANVSEADYAWEVVLAGFDLRTPAGVQADQIQVLDLAIDSVWRDLQAQKLKFRVRAGLRMACPTLDCEPLNQVVEYDLHVHWQVIGGPGFRAQRNKFGSSRDWEKRDTAPAVEAAKIVLLGDGHYRQATVGITGLHLRLDRPALMLAWDSHLEGLSYTNGLMTMLLRMDFVQNRPGMETARRTARKSKPRPAARCNIKAHPGTLIWEMEVSLLQFEDASIDSKVIR